MKTTMAIEAIAPASSREPWLKFIDVNWLGIIFLWFKFSVGLASPLLTSKVISWLDLIE